jgi:CheY-like chemotaxis protein
MELMERTYKMKPSILIVDDEKVICNGISKLLANDYTTYKAHNAIDALSIINNLSDIDVMLCDIKMPGMEGGELIERVRTENKDVYIIVITAAASPITVCDALKKGANYYLRKPFDISHLETSVQNAVDRSKKYTATNSI